ncbi:MAG: hypothetical protein H0W88_07880 [Parachlamydiaceae bacterium]|nr:hypothetical protein [Parachlamydiaceae bacterium]
MNKLTHFLSHQTSESQIYDKQKIGTKEEQKINQIGRSTLIVETTKSSHTKLEKKIEVLSCKAIDLSTNQGNKSLTNRLALVETYLSNSENAELTGNQVRNALRILNKIIFKASLSKKEATLVYRLRGEVFLKLNRFKEAIDDLEYVRQGGNSKVGVLIYLAEANLKVGDHSRSYQVIKEILNSKEDATHNINKKLLPIIKEIYEKNMDKVLGRQTYEIYQELDLLENVTGKSVVQLEEFLKKYPNTIKILLELANRQYANKNYPEAIKAYENIKQRAKQNHVSLSIQLFLNLAEAYIHNENSNAAFENIKICLKFGDVPIQLKAYRLQFMIQQRAGNRMNALFTLESMHAIAKETQDRDWIRIHKRELESELEKSFCF